MIHSALAYFTHKWTLILSFIWTLSLFLFALRVVFEQGHWPEYANPDPKNTKMLIHYFGIWLLGYLLFWFALYESMATYFTQYPRAFTFLKVAIVSIALLLLAVSGEFRGVLIWGAMIGFFILSVYLFCFFLLRCKKNTGLIQLSILMLFWAHVLIDPFHLVEWFVD